MIVKKYGNRRLYDTAQSRYITLEELAQQVRAGGDVQVVDAKTGEDLTQATLAQVILESRGAARLLPVPLLVQLIRLGDEALAEFFGNYMSWALELYRQVRQGAQRAIPYDPFAAFQGLAPGAFGRAYPAAPWGEPARAPAPAGEGEVAALRRELDQLKRSMRKRRK